jgi:hypothetical protein
MNETIAIAFATIVAQLPHLRIHPSSVWPSRAIGEEENPDGQYQKN